MKTKLLFIFLFISLFSFGNNEINTFEISVSTDMMGRVIVTKAGNGYYPYWDIEYGAVGFVSGSGTAINNISTSQTTINLLPFVVYEIKGRGKLNFNNSGTATAWTTPISINACVNNSIALNYSNNFNGLSEDICWKGRFVSSSYYNANVAIDQNQSANNDNGSSIKVTSYSGSTFLVAPRVNDLSTERKITFWIKNYTRTGSQINNLSIGTLSNPNDGNTFSLISTVNLNPINSTDWIQKTIYFNNYNGSDEYIAFKYTYGSGAQNEIFIDNVEYLLSENCLIPTNLQVSNITSTTAQLDFSSLNTNWQVSLNNLDSYQTEILNFNTNPYLLSNLDEGTNYEIKIRSKCDISNNSNWSTTQTFTTLCSQISTGFYTTFGENNYLLPCWSFLGTSGSASNTTALVYNVETGNLVVNPKSGSRMVSMIDNSSTQSSYLITPYVNDLSNNRRVRFYLAATGYSNNYIDNELIIGTMSNPNDASTFIPLETISPNKMNQPLGFFVEPYLKEHIVYFTNYNSGLNHKYIAIKSGLNERSTFYIDDFYYEDIPSCIEPVNLRTINTTELTANLTWDEDLNSQFTQWEIEFGPTGFIQGTGTIVQATSNPFTLNTGLQGFTNYEYYVRNICGTNYSNWSDRGIFKTKCEGISLGYQTSFENDIFYEDNTCWNRLTPLIRNPYYSQDGFVKFIPTGSGIYTIPHTGTKMLKFFSYINAPATDVNLKTIIVTPRLVDFDNNKKISFWALFKNSAYNTQLDLQVGTLSDPDDYNTFTVHEVITININSNSNNNNNQDWNQYVIDFSNYYGNDEYVGIRTLVGGSSNYYSFFDDFEYLQNDCVSPTNLLAYQSNTNQATLEWNTNSILNPNCIIEYGEYGFTLGTGTLLNVNASTSTIDNLLPIKRYQFRVRNVCQNGEINWSPLYAFKITCENTAPFIENFDQYSSFNSQWENTLCWTTSNILKAGIDEHSLYNINSSPNSAFIDRSDENTFLISPFLSDLNSTKKIKFWLENNKNVPQESLIVGTIKNPLDYNTFEFYTSIPIDNLPAYGKEFEVNFDQYLGTNKHIVFYAEGMQTNGFNGTQKIYIDDLHYSDISSCNEPINIEFLNIDDHSVVVKWNDINGQNLQIEYGLSGFVLGTGTIINTNLNQIDIINLSAQNNYDFYFKKICSTTETSILVGPKKITTLCAQTNLPWTESFNQMSSYGNDLLPNCFKKLSGTVSSHNSPVVLPNNTSYFQPDHILDGNGDNSFLRFNNGFATNLSSPSFYLTAGTSYKFSLDCRKSYEYGYNDVKLFVGRGNEQHFMQATLYSNDPLSEYYYDTKHFYYTPVQSGNYSFILEFYNPGGLNMIADNFKLDEGYNTIINSTTSFNFENTNYSLLNFENTESTSNTIIAENGNGVLRMNGSTMSHLSITGSDLWDNNQQNITKVNFKINPQGQNQLFLKFDLKQTFNTLSTDSRFRVVVNGNVLLSDITASTNNQDQYQNFVVDLSSYTNNDIRVSLQHLGRSANSIGDNAYLDNVEITNSILNYNIFNKSYFTIFPNPAKDNFTLQYDVAQENASVSLYDISGRIMYQNTLSSTAGELQVNTGNYQAGIYIVVVKQNNKVIQQEKLIIE